MIYSMTGFGHGSVSVKGYEIQVDIKTLNSKGADVIIRSGQLLKQFEIPIKKVISDILLRGKIEVFVSEEFTGDFTGQILNTALLRQYWKEITAFADENALDPTLMASSLVRLPEVVQTTDEVLDEEDEGRLLKGIEEICRTVMEYRLREGKALEADLVNSVETITRLLGEIEEYEEERVEAVRKRLRTAFDNASVTADKDRFEQELIYYLEKLDINEEKTRLIEHCRYFSEILGNDVISKGKKLGFISQEMGREINTIGSKASHAGMQRKVVQMKDHLEKIKEQVLNVL